MYIKINNTKYPCTVIAELDGDGISFSGVTGMDKPPTAGIVKWFADDGFELGAADIAAFKRCVLDGSALTLMNTPAPTPPTEAELLAQARTAAQERISGKCSTAICSGVTVDGKHYALSDRDQLSLNAAWAQVNGGAATVPYAADGEALTDYTAAQITSVGKRPMTGVSSAGRITGCCISGCSERRPGTGSRASSMGASCRTT